MNYKTIEKFPYGNTLINIQLNRLLGKKAKSHMIDIGSYDGTFAKWVAERYKRMTVHAIEPSESAYAVVRKAVAGCPNVRCHHLAISSRTERAEFYVDVKKDGVSQSSSLIKSQVSKPQIEMVKTMTLHDFCMINNINEIALMIMNCEGSEFDIFSHEPSWSMIKNRVRILNIALHGKDFPFIGEKFTKQKRHINKELLGAGFYLVYGQDLTTLKRLPTGHINQIWVRE